MTRRGGGGASSKLSTKPEQSKPAAGDPPVPKLPREQTFGPGKKKPSGPPVELSFGPGKPGAVPGKTGGRKRRKHRKTHRKTHRGY